MTRNAPAPYPHDLDAERACLGAYIQRPDLLDECRLRPRDCYSGDHAAILGLLLRMRRGGEPIDAVTLLPRLAREYPDETRYGGVGYVLGLEEACPAPAAIRHYEQQVVTDAERRAVRRAAEEAIEAITAGEPADVIASLRGALDEASSRTQSRWHALGDVLRGGLQQIESMRGGNRSPAVPTGIWRLDELLGGGLWPGDLILLAARPSMGKTALALAMAHHAAALDQPAGVVSIEMSRDQLALRYLAGAGYGGGDALRRGDIDDERLDALWGWADSESALPLWIDDSGGAKPEDVSARCRQLDREVRGRGYDQGVRLIVVDYLQLIRVRTRQGENRAQAVGDVSAGLKQLARDLDCPVLALSQLSRDLERRDDKRPKMSDLRDSGALEQDADVVIGLYRDDVYDQESRWKGYVEAAVLKHRQGALGRLLLHWDAPTYTYSDAPEGAYRVWRDAPTKRRRQREAIDDV